MSTCPKCGDSVGFVKSIYVDIRTPDQNWVGLSLVCPKCDAILGVSIDPIALKNDIAQEVVDRLQRRPDD
jgi:hypothetical protein